MRQPCCVERFQALQEGKKLLKNCQNFPKLNSPESFLTYVQDLVHPVSSFVLAESSESANTIEQLSAIAVGHDQVAIVLVLKPILWHHDTTSLHGLRGQFLMPDHVVDVLHGGVFPAGVFRSSTSSGLRHHLTRDFLDGHNLSGGFPVRDGTIVKARVHGTLEQVSDPDTAKHGLADSVLEPVGAVVQDEALRLVELVAVEHALLEIVAEVRIVLIASGRMTRWTLC